MDGNKIFFPALAIGVIFFSFCSVQYAYAFGPGEDISSYASVTSAGVVTLDPLLLAEAIFTVTGWTDPGFSSQCLNKTNNFHIPFSISACNLPAQQYRLDVSTTNTATYPSGQLGEIFIYRGSGGSYVLGNAEATRFITYTPEIGTSTPYATSTTFAFGATGYIDPDDWNGTATVRIRYSQKTGQGIRGNGYLLDQGEFIFPISAPGMFSVSTTSSVQHTGAYITYFAIEQPRLYLFTNTLVSSIGNFIVVEADLNEVLITQILSETTGIGSGVIPVVSDATSTLNLGSAYGIADIILQKFPVNWVIDFAAVLTQLSTQTSTTTIPDVKINFGGLHTLQSIPTTTPLNVEFTFFSAATLVQVSGYTWAITMRWLISASLWIGLAYYAWNRAATLFVGPMNTL